MGTCQTNYIDPANWQSHRAQLEELFEFVRSARAVSNLKPVAAPYGAIDTFEYVLTNFLKLSPSALSILVTVGFELIDWGSNHGGKYPSEVLNSILSSVHHYHLRPLHYVNCDFCHCAFATRSYDCCYNIFCSDICKSRFYDAKKEAKRIAKFKTKDCEICGVVIPGRRYGAQKYCGKVCRKVGEKVAATTRRRRVSIIQNRAALRKMERSLITSIKDKK